MKKKLVVLSGAGISAESGIKTFRASDGLWENHRIEDVASPEGWEKNPQLVLDFYNQRRKNCVESEPNLAHKILVDLETFFDVTIITQNVDNLHERAGSSNVIHLHGELTKVRSEIDPEYIIDIGGKPLSLGDHCPKGGQLRPHIVWFGEPVPMIDYAVEYCQNAQIFIVIGTSLQVYPAAGLIHLVADAAPKYVIDPQSLHLNKIPNVHVIQEIASIGMQKVSDLLLLKEK